MYVHLLSWFLICSFIKFSCPSISFHFLSCSLALSLSLILALPCSFLIPFLYLLFHSIVALVPSKLSFLCQTPDIGVVLYFPPQFLEGKITYNFLVSNVGMKFPRFLIFHLSQLIFKPTFTYIYCQDVCNFIFLYFYVVLMSD